MLHVYNRTLLSTTNDDISLLVSTWLDLENIMLNEISLKEKDKNHMISHVGGI